MGREPTRSWKTIANGLKGGTIIPFLGAGASSYVPQQQGGCPPSGATLLEELAKESRLNFRCEFNSCTRPRYDLPRVASYYQLVSHSRRSLDELLKELTGNPNCEPNPLHRLLARVAKHRPMLAITTNYDALLEKAFDEIGALYDVVATAADCLEYRRKRRDDDDPTDYSGPDNGGMIYHRRGGDTEFEAVLPRDLDLDLDTRSIIYKVHGSVSNGGAWPGGYLIAEEDYTRFLGRMHLEHIFPYKIRRIMRKMARLPDGRQILTNSLLFLGYSLNDWNLRVLMDEMGVSQWFAGEEVHYAVLKSDDRPVEDLLNKRNINPVVADLGEFVYELDQTLTGIGLPASLR